MGAAQQTSTGAPDSTGSGLDAAGVLELRRAIYAQDGVTRDELAGLLARGRAAGLGACAEYADLLAEAATDLLVTGVNPVGYITPDDADWLIGQLADGGGLSCQAEFAMLVRVLSRAVSAPPALAAFAVAEVAKAIITGRRAALGQVDHPPGVVTAEDVETLHALVFAPTEGSALHVTRQSAEALFEIARAVAAGADNPAFDDLFAKAIGNYLMGVSFHWMPTVLEAREHAEWVDNAARFADFFSRMVERPVAKTFGGLRTELKSVGDIEEDALAEDNAADARAIEEARVIKPSDADWVIAHLTRGGPLSPAEKKLLGFLAQEAASMPPSLRAIAEQGE